MAGDERYDRREPKGTVRRGRREWRSYPRDRGNVACALAGEVRPQRSILHRRKSDAAPAPGRSGDDPQGYTHLRHLPGQPATWPPGEWSRLSDRQEDVPSQDQRSEEHTSELQSLMRI